MSSYERINWADAPETPLNAANMNHMDEGIERLYENISNQNLLINGNLEIWTNGTSFEVKSDGEEAITPVGIANRWFAFHNDATNTFSVSQRSDGLRILSASDQECFIYQVLEEETYNAIKGKTLTLSYAYTQSLGDANHVEYERIEETKQIVANDDDALTFALNNAIALTNGAAGCVLHYVKLEVGIVQTPCVPDAKDAIICKLEKDYIVEQGTDDIWTYRKWASGIAECWGEQLYTTDVTNAIGNIYSTSEESPLVSPNYPANLFVENPYSEVNVGGISGYLAWGARSNYGDTISPGKFFIMRATKDSAGHNYPVRFHAIGRWKEIEVQNG